MFLVLMVGLLQLLHRCSVVQLRRECSRYHKLTNLLQIAYLAPREEFGIFPLRHDRLGVMLPDAGEPRESRSRTKPFDMT